MALDLRPYQREDVVYLTQHWAHGIFSEQRTGKSVTALATLHARGCKRVLVVCPASMVYQWKAEFMRYFETPCYVYGGTSKQREQILANWTDGLVVSYDLYKATSARSGLATAVIKLKPAGLIVDEAHKFIGRDSANFKSIRRLVKIPNRLYLTGTPAPNHPSQVWSILTMIDPQRFSSYWRFVDEFFEVDEQRLPEHVARYTGNQIVRTPASYKPGAEQKLANLIDQYAIMRKYKDVMEWVNECTPTRIKLAPTKQQLKYLKELCDYFETEHVIVQGVLDRIIRYRQICQAPEILGLDGNSPKLEWILQYIKDYPDKQVVIFSRFTKFIELLEEKTESKIVKLVGDTPKDVRQKYIEGFQDGSIKVLAIQIDAGKEGITLSNGDTIIFADVYPPASDILQARARITATSIETVKPKEIIELMLEGTYDELLYDIVDNRIQDTDPVNNFNKFVRR